MSEPCRVVVVDDSPKARQALREVVQATPGLLLAATLNSGEEAVTHLANATTPVLVVMDVRMPGIGGVEAARRIADSRRGHLVLLVSAHDEVDLVLVDGFGTFINKSHVTGRRLLDEAWRIRQAVITDPGQS